MKRTLARIAVSLFVVGLVLSVAGCQSIAEKATEAAVEKATGVQVDKDGEQITIKGEDGAELTASSDGELPDGFPSDVPVFEGKVVSSIKAEKGFSVTIEAEAGVMDVFDFYKDKLPAEGWNIVSEMKVEDGGAIVAEKGDQSVQVTVGVDSGDANKATISLFTGTK